METSLEVSRLLERELSWSMRRCPLRFLAKSVRILHDNSNLSAGPGGESGSNVKELDVLQSAVQVLHRRWIEAITGSDFISLFQVIDLFDDERKLKVEERAADVAHQFSSGEMLKVKLVNKQVQLSDCNFPIYIYITSYDFFTIYLKMFVVLGAKKRRPTPLLRVLAFHFSKAEHKISAKEAIELIYALNELTFADPVRSNAISLSLLTVFGVNIFEIYIFCLQILMNKLCSDLAQDIPQIKNSALISSLMTSLGQMRYKNKGMCTLCISIK